MPEVHQAPSGGKGRDASAALDLGDPAAVRAWIAAVRAQIDDLHAAGEDATRALGRRALGRPTARAAIHDAHRSLDALMRSVEQSLTP